MELNDWLIARQIPFASAAQISEWCGSEPRQVSSTLRRAREAGRMECIVPHGWVPLSEHGVRPFAHDYLPDLMRHLRCDYYISYAYAARLAHRASHQAVLTTQLAVARRLSFAAGHRLRIDHVHKPRLEDFPTMTLRLFTLFGHRRLVCGTVETTLLDVVQRPGLSGGLYNVANIAAEMLDSLLDASPEGIPARRIDPDKLAETALLYPVSVRQRAGYILQEMSEHMEVPFDLGPMSETIPRETESVALEPGSLLLHPAWKPTDYLYDPKWKLRVEHALDPDVSAW